MGPQDAGSLRGELHKLPGTATFCADSEEQARRMQVINAVAFGMSALVAAHAVLIHALIAAPWLSGLGAGFALLLLLPVVFNQRGHDRRAALLLLVTANVGLAVYGLALGNESGVYLGGVFWTVACTLLLDPNRRLTLAAARTLPIMVLGATYVYGLEHEPWAQASPAALDVLFATSLATTLLLLLLATAAQDAAARRRARELEASHERAQQKLDRALRESEGRFGLLLQQAGDALLVVAEDGTVVDANAQATTDLGLDPTGRPVWDVDTTLSRAVLRPLMRELLAGTRYRAEHTYRRADGGTFLADVRAGAIRTAAGRQLLISARDTSEQRELQSQLLMAERLASVGTLAAGVAHEINNPLSFIHMHVEMLERRLAPYLPAMADADADAVEQSLSRAHEGTSRVGRIVGDLMTFARGQDTDLGTADVAEVLRSTLSLAEPELRGGVRIERDISAVPPARASASRLGQVFLNLVLNAHHALGQSDVDEPTLTVRVRYLPDGIIEVLIADNGPGMSEAVAHRVFEPFYTTKQAGAGTGLGLFVCRNLVTEAGGSIELETAPHEGARFVVRLPAASEHDMVPDRNDPSQSGVRGREARRQLDETGIRGRRSSQSA